ncbi:MAG: hypothetical protein F6K39_15755 [Okeania sp. SIO3B3]|nr:hypothetical protein [Okeania sp. SIO3B3]
MMRAIALFLFGKAIAVSKYGRTYAVPIYIVYFLSITPRHLYSYNSWIRLAVLITIREIGDEIVVIASIHSEHI